MEDEQFKIGLSKKTVSSASSLIVEGLARAGRKGIGITKKISLTLTKDIWEEIDRECEERAISRSSFFRNIMESYYAAANKKDR